MHVSMYICNAIDPDLQCLPGQCLIITAALHRKTPRERERERERESFAFALLGPGRGSVDAALCGCAADDPWCVGACNSHTAAETEPGPGGTVAD